MVAGAAEFRRYVPRYHARLNNAANAPSAGGHQPPPHRTGQEILKWAQATPAEVSLGYVGRSERANASTDRSEEASQGKATHATLFIQLLVA